MGCLNSTIKAGSDRGNRTNIQILTGDHIDVNETKPKRVSRTGRNPQVELPRILENEDVPEQKSSNSEVLEKKQGLQFERARLEARNAELLQENTDLRLRLSSVMGTRLTTNNPNITDLSDANRPAKLADQFSELYDNEWTDAYVKLEETFESCPLKSRKRVKEICNVLLQILYKTYLECNSKAETEMDALLMAYRAVCGEEVNLEVSKQIKTKRKNNYKCQLQAVSMEEVNLEVSKQIKTKRKNTYKCQLQAVSMVVDREISSYIDNHLRLKNAPDVMKRIKPYTDRCLELCWLMVIQDPPVYICCDKITTKMKVDFNKDVYREYTLPGKKIAYVVWPVLYLHKGGPMLKKGIAQGSAKNTQTLTGIGNRKNVQIDQNVKKPMNSTVFVTTVAETTKERPTSEDGEKSDDFMF